MKRVVGFFAIVVVFCFVGVVGAQNSDPSIPKLTTDTGWWIDTTGRVPADTMTALKAESDSMKKDGFQVAGVIFATSGSSELEMATKFGNADGVGSKGKDNGVAIAIFLDKKNSSGVGPTIGVAVGSGLEGLLNDAKVGRFLDQTFVPLRKDGKWGDGTVAFLKILHKYLLTPTADEFKDAAPPPINATTILIVVVLVVVYLSVDGFIFKFEITMSILDILASSSGGTGGGGFTGSSGGGGGPIGGGGSFTGGGTSR